MNHACWISRTTNTFDSTTSNDLGVMLGFFYDEFSSMCRAISTFNTCPVKDNIEVSFVNNLDRNGQISFTLSCSSDIIDDLIAHADKHIREVLGYNNMVEIESEDDKVIFTYIPDTSQFPKSLLLL